MPSCRTDVPACRRLLARTLSLFKSGYLLEAEATFHSALRPLSADDVPIIGTHYEWHWHAYISVPYYVGRTLIPNLYLIGGHGSKGWTLSFGSVKLLADIVLDRKADVRARSSPKLRKFTLKYSFSDRPNTLLSASLPPNQAPICRHEINHYMYFRSFRSGHLVQHRHDRPGGGRVVSVHSNLASDVSNCERVAHRCVPASGAAVAQCDARGRARGHRDDRLY